MNELKDEITEAQRQSSNDKKTITKLEKTIKSLQERETQLEKEVEELSSEEKAKGGESDKQVKAMRLELKGVKGDLRSKEEEVKELEEEMERIRKEFREREKSTKRENRENVDLKDKIANLEVSNNVHSILVFRLDSDIVCGTTGGDRLAPTQQHRSGREGQEVPKRSQGCGNCSFQGEGKECLTRTCQEESRAGSIGSRC